MHFYFTVFFPLRNNGIICSSLCCYLLIQGSKRDAYSRRRGYCNEISSTTPYHIVHVPLKLVRRKSYFPCLLYDIYDIWIGSRSTSVTQIIDIWWVLFLLILCFITLLVWPRSIPITQFSIYAFIWSDSLLYGNVFNTIHHILQTLEGSMCVDAL